MSTPCYVVATIELAVELGQYFEEYGMAVVSQIAANGGEVLAATTDLNALEGDIGKTDYMVIVRFPDNASMERWYNSSEYQPYIKLRQDKLTRSGAIVQLPGFDPAALAS